MLHFVPCVDCSRYVHGQSVTCGIVLREGMRREDAGTYWSGRQRGGKPGDRRVGVVWHTQGNWKSFSKLFLAARVVRASGDAEPANVGLLTLHSGLSLEQLGESG